MKQFFLSLLLLFLSVLLYAQVPQAFNYQAVIRNGNNPVDDPSLSVRVHILKDAPNGPLAFEKTFTDQAAVNGQVNLKIGSANPTGFAAINWSSGTYFISIDYDLDNGTNFSNTIPGQILAVPYALYAEQAGSSGDWEQVGDSVLYTAHPTRCGAAPAPTTR